MENQTRESNELLNYQGMRSASSRWVQWLAPQNGWYKLNTDGAYKRDSGLASASGFLRDENGSWLWGFMVKIGKGDSFMQSCGA